MKWFSKEEDLQQNIYLLLLAILLMVMPVRRVATSIPLILLTAHWVFRWNWKEKLENWRRHSDKVVALSFVVYFLLLFPGLLYTQNIPAGWYDIQLKLMCVLVPLIVYTSKPIARESLDKLLMVFILSCLAQTLLAYGYLVWRYMHYTGPAGKFPYTYQALVSFTSIHPTYLAVYCLAALFSFFYILRKKWSSLPKGIKLLGLIGVADLLVFIILLAARTQVITLFVLLNLAALGITLRSARKLQWVLIWLVLNVAIIAIVSSVKVTRERLKLVYHAWFEEADPTGYRSGSKRLLIWSCALDAAKQHPILGVGTGDANFAMAEEYQKRGYQEGLAEHLNTHNQMLHAWLTRGVLGVLALLQLLVIPVILAYKRGRWLFLAFWAIAVIAMLAENLFQSQGGLIYYVLFTCLLLSATSGQRLQDQVVHKQV